MDALLLASGALDLGSAAFFAVLGSRVARRAVSPPARPATLELAVFWCGLAAHVATTGFYSIWGSIAPVPIALAVSLVNLQSLLLCILLWGITGYLYYLVTGRYYTIAVSVLYGAYYLLLQYFLISDFTTLETATEPGLRILLSVPIPPTITTVIVLAVVAPPIAAAVSYLALSRVAPDRTVVYRLGVVGAALLLWFGPASYYVVGGDIGVELLIAFQSVALVMIGLAYFPPRALRERLRVNGLIDPWTAGT